MRKDGFVSLWAGIAPSKKHLLTYIDFNYDEDGEVVPSPFMVSFKLKSEWDEDTRESDFTKAHRSISDRLPKFSFGEQLRESFRELIGERLDDACNAMLLLYNYKYNGKIGEVAEPFSFRFYGVVPYEDDSGFDVEELLRAADLEGDDD